MASVFLPELETDGIGAAILPEIVTGKNKFALVVYFRDSESNAALMRRITALSRHENGNFLVQSFNIHGYSVAVFEPGFVFSRRAWSGLGIRQFRLESYQNTVDLEDHSAIRNRLDGALSELNLRDDFFRPSVIGINRYGEEVTNGPLGRSLVRKGVSHGEWEMAPSGQLKGVVMGDAFFRGNTHKDFSGCARAIAIAIGKGVKFDQSSLLRMYDFIMEGSPALRNEIGFRLMDMQEEMESHLSSLIGPLSARSTDPRSVVIKIDQSMPAHNQRNGTRMVLQQYSTPFPIGRVAVETLLPQPGESLLEPTVGNGVLVSGFLAREVAITGVELDQSRSIRARSIVNGSGNNVIQGDFFKVGKEFTQKFDLIVANPPFGKLDKIAIGQDVFNRNIRLRTLHHQIVFEALRQRTDKGRAFFVLPGDVVQKGEIAGADRFFDNWLRATYHVAGSASIDGRLYRKMGTEYPVIIYAVGPKRDTALTSAEIEAEAPERHELILSYDELFAWSDRTQERMRELISLSFVDVSPSLETEPSTTQPSEPAVQGEPERQSDSSEASASEELSSSIPSLPGVLVDDIEDDPFVRRYEAFSALGEARTQIQKSLQGLTYQALLDVERKHGSVDDYVAGKFGLSKNDLSDRFSPEQIDALALNFARQEEKKGFLNADLTGVGKGRFLAGTMYAAFREDRPVIFLTEQPNLFSDMLARDMVNVTMKSVEDLKNIIRPFIFNQSRESEVRNLEDNKLIYKTGNLREAKDKGISTDFNCILSSYSQFQVASGSWKLEALLEWITQNVEMGRRPHLVLDEVHRAAGELSVVSGRIEALVNRIEKVGGTVTFSSATPLKSGRNIRVYRPILPELGMNTNALIELIEQNPLALQEVLSSEMARMGTLISREVESRDNVKRFIPLVDLDPDRYERIVRATDLASGLLRETVDVAREINFRAKELIGIHSSSNPEEKVGITTTSPVTQFHSYCQYLLVAVKTAFARELIVSAVAQGKKPVLVVENTGKELLSRMAEREGNSGQVDRLPDMGDLLSEMADKVLDVQITDNFGGGDKVRITQYEGWLNTFRKKVEEARREGLNELSIAPLDYLQQIGNDLGLRFGELTKRQLRTEKQENGTYLIESRRPEDKRVVIRSFNNGDIDFIGMNRSAASGVSMHASPDTGDDLRPRVMIKLQLQSDVTQERQIDGRINRYGQVHPAEYWFPMSGFAADDRLVQLFNRKNRSLSATSSASRENASNIEEVTDLLNPIGEKVAKEYLSEHEELARVLGIVSSADADADDGDTVRRLMGRLVMLPVEQSNVIMSELDTHFRMVMEALDAQGQNPLRLRQFDWKAHIEVLSVLKPGEDGAEAIGKRPVNLVRLTYKEQLEAINSKQVNLFVQAGIEKASEKGNGRALSGRELIGKIFDENGVPNLSLRLFDKAMARSDEAKSFGKQEIAPEAALAVWRARKNMDKEKAKSWEKALLRAFTAAEFLDAQLDYLIPGHILGVKQEFYPQLFDKSSLVAMLSAKSEGDESLHDMLAVLARISFNEDDPLNLANWKIGIAMPGQRTLEDVSLSSAFAVYKNLEQGKEHNVSPVIWKNALATDTIALLPEVSGVLAPTEHDENIAPYYTNPIWKAYMDQLFDTAPSGEIARERYALEGNMFLSMYVTQSNGNKLGQKAIYTSDTGEIRHAVILKAGAKLDELCAEIKNRMDSAPIISPFQNGKNLTAACEAYVNLLEVIGSGPYQLTGHVEAGCKSYGRLVENLTDLFSKDSETRDQIRNYVTENLDMMVCQIVKGLGSDYVPELFVGTVDVFNDNTIYKSILGSYKTSKGDNYTTVSQVINEKNLINLASSIPDQDAHFVIGDIRSAFFFNRKASDLIENAKKCGMESLLEQSSNTYPGLGKKLTKGTLCFVEYLPKSKYMANLVRVIQMTAELKQSKVQLRGPIASAFKNFEYFSEKAQEIVAKKQLDCDCFVMNDQNIIVN